jgi:hypothetical protein
MQRPQSHEEFYPTTVFKSCFKHRMQIIRLQNFASGEAKFCTSIQPHQSRRIWHLCRWNEIHFKHLPKCGI